MVEAMVIKKKNKKQKPKKKTPLWQNSGIEKK